MLRGLFPMFRVTRPSGRRSLSAALAVLAALAFSAPALAMRMSPMVAEISVSGAGLQRAHRRRQRQRAQPMPYETHITRVEFDENGALHETPADDDFLVFPPQGGDRRAKGTRPSACSGWATRC